MSSETAFRLTARVSGMTLTPDPGWPADPPNVYLIQGDDAWAMFDAGWGRGIDADAIEAWLAGARPRGTPSRLWLSHAHRDHVGGAAWVARRYGLVPTALETERATADRHFPGLAFEPAYAGEAYDLGGARVTLLGAPGHTAGSLCAFLEANEGADILFTGDTVVGRHSSWIGPPDGDLEAYLQTLARLADPALPYAAARLAPGHGPAGAVTGAVAATLRERRLARDEDILRLLPDAPSPRRLVRRLYGEARGPILGPGGVAERTVVAHLERLVRLGRAAVKDEGPDPFLRTYRPTAPE